METKELLRKIKKIELRTRGLTKQVFSGQYHSAFKGKGMAFSEVRDYYYGDDVKTIDWNVTARFNEPFVKVFEEERELVVILLIDISGSIDFGSQEKSKRDLALEISAILSFSALSNNDKVGAIFYSDQVEKYISPGKGRKHILKILRELIEIQAESKGTSINEALKFLRNTQKKRAIAFVVSDFNSEEGIMDSFRISSKKHDVVALHTIDPMERELPSIGFIELENAETGERTWVNSNNKRVKEEFAKNYDKRLATITSEFRSAGIDHCFLNTTDDFIIPLIQLFKHRK